jgi:hypothetical protein
MGEHPLSRTNDLRSFLVGWLVGAAIGHLLPGILCLTLLSQRGSDQESQLAHALALLFWLCLILGVPSLGAAAVGGALGVGRWLAAAVCFPAAVAFALACWRSAYGPGALKAMAVLVPLAVVNTGVAAVTAGKVARDRRAG